MRWTSALTLRTDFRCQILNVSVSRNDSSVSTLEIITDYVINVKCYQSHPSAIRQLGVTLRDLIEGVREGR